MSALDRRPYDADQFAAFRADPRNQALVDRILNSMPAATAPVKWRREQLVAGPSTRTWRETVGVALAVVDYWIERLQQ